MDADAHRCFQSGATHHFPWSEFPSAFIGVHLRQLTALTTKKPGIFKMPGLWKLSRDGLKHTSGGMVTISSKPQRQPELLPGGQWGFGGESS